MHDFGNGNISFQRFPFPLFPKGTWKMQKNLWTGKITINLKDLTLVSVIGDLVLQPRDAMGLKTAYVGSVCVRARPPGLNQTPQQRRPLSPLHEPPHWKAKSDPKA